MIDRNVGFPNRFRMTKVEGTDDIYDLIPAPGEVIAPGDTFSKANMLPDSIPAALGLKMPNPQVADALNVLANVGNLHVWKRVQSGVTDYLTSTDRNAYPDQSAEGGQDAYYTLGEKTETWINSVKKDTDTAYGTLASSVTVSDTGQVSLVSPNVNQQLSTETSSNFADVAQDRLRGTYLLRSDGSVWYVPTDAVVHVSYYGISKYGAPYDVCFYTKMQPVTGHAAIPAKTTITYLGQLGGRARIEVGSYVGTRTYGSSNPNTLTFGFEPKIVFVVGRVFLDALNTKTQLGVFNMLALTDEYLQAGYFEYDTSRSSSPSGSKYAKKNGNTLSWYSTDSSTSQMNGTWSEDVSTYTYFAFA